MVQLNSCTIFLCLHFIRLTKTKCMKKPSPVCYGKHETAFSYLDNIRIYMRFRLTNAAPIQIDCLGKIWAKLDWAT